MKVSPRLPRFWLKRIYSKISLILLDHDSRSSRPFITWTNEKEPVYMELKNIISLIPIHFLNKLGTEISRCASETKIQMLNDLTIKSGLKKGNLSCWFLVIMFLLPLLPQGITYRYNKLYQKFIFNSTHQQVKRSVGYHQTDLRHRRHRNYCCCCYCCLCPSSFRKFGQQSWRTPLK